MSYSVDSSLPETVICRISVTFVLKDGEEQQIEVPVGMSMLEAAHQNDIELEGKEFDSPPPEKAYALSSVSHDLNIYFT